MAAVSDAAPFVRAPVDPNFVAKYMGYFRFIENVCGISLNINSTVSNDALPSFLEVNRFRRFA